MPPSIQPFPYSNLPRLTKQEAMVRAAVARYFPSSTDVGPAIGKLQWIAAKLMSVPVTARFESIFESKYQPFISALPEKFVCYVVSLSPHPWPIIVEWDYELALGVIDQLLGGSAEAPEGGAALSKPALLKPVTELEHGALEYWGAYWLYELNEWMAAKKTKFNLNRTALAPDQLERIHDGETAVTLITFRVSVKDILGYVRLCVPQALFTEVLKSPGDFFGNGTLWEPFLAKRFTTVSHLKAMAWAEAGRVNLTARELGSLEAGDIILFDESPAHYRDSQVSGEAILRFGEGTQGGVMARIQEKEGHYELVPERVFLENG